MVREADSKDAEKVASIYNHYIANTVVTFEEAAVTARGMSDRIRDTQAQELPYLVAENEAGNIVGYAYASKWKGRCAYRHSVEVTVYLSHTEKSQGWGSKLYERLFEELSQRSIHVAIGGISLPNPQSIGLHEKFGMKKVAHFEQVGFKFNQWVDVGYWQKILN